MNGSGNCNPNSRTQNEGMWPTPSCVTVTQHNFEAIEEDKAVSAWPVLSAYSTASSSKPKAEPIVDPSEKVKKAETAASCRLFGIELISHSVSPQRPEKVCLELPSMSAFSNDWSVADSLLKTGLPKSSKDSNEGQSQAWPKESQSKQSLTSSRSRTKVLKIC